MVALRRFGFPRSPALVVISDRATTSQRWPRLGSWPDELGMNAIEHVLKKVARLCRSTADSHTRRGIARRQSLHRLTDFAAGNLRCGGEDRLLVGFADGKPGREILRVIGAGIVCDAQVRAEKDGVAAPVDTYRFRLLNTP